MFRKSVPFCFALLLALSLFSTTEALAARGRPTVSGGTFVTDTGQPLRGAQWSMDYNNGALPYCFTPSQCSSKPCTYGAPSCPMIDAIKTRGLNALHIYVEKQGTPVGAHAVNVDQMIDWTDSAGLYAIIVIGGPGCDISYTNSFWSFYAPRYANRTHVIYEIKNEPEGSLHQPSTACVTDMNKQAYSTIRSLAPNTAILLFSYGWFENGPGLVQDINAVSSVVSWSNAGVAFHGYQEACLASLDCEHPESTLAAINYVKANKPNVPLMNTEFYVVVDNTVSPYVVRTGKTQIYEDSHVSWLSFIPIDIISDKNFNDVIDQEELVWNNEWGFPWPAVNTPPINSKVTLRARNGYFATVDASTGKVYANSTIAGSAQTFAVKSSCYYICLQSLLNDKFVNANASNLYKLETGVTSCNNGRFEWMKKPDGTVVLRAQINGQTVDANPLADSQLIAKRIDSPSGEYTNFTVATVPDCVPNSTTLCFQGNRFKAQVTWRNGTSSGQGFAMPYSDQGGFFYFFGSNNPEMGVKLVDGRALNGKFWIFHDALTTVEYTLTVIDMVTGTVKTYLKPAGSVCGGADTGSFTKASVTSKGFAIPLEGKPQAVARAACTPTSTSVCLLGGRFRTEVKRNGAAQPAVAFSDIAGTFWFFASANPEVAVKVIDGRPVNGRYWVFFGPLTDQAYQVVVTDTNTGAVKTYNSPPPYCGIADTSAF